MSDTKSKHVKYSCSILHQHARDDFFWLNLEKISPDAFSLKQSADDRIIGGAKTGRFEM